MSDLFRNPITFVRGKKAEETKRIGIVSSCRGAGGTFYCSQMALKSKNSAHIVELGKSNYYLAYGMERRFLGQKLVFCDQAAGTEKVADSFVTMFGLSYLVRDPKVAEALSYEQLCKLILFAPNGDVFYDFSGVAEDLVLSLISEMDEVYIVIDPLPTKLLGSARFLEKLRLSYPKAQLVVNRMNKGVHRPELKRFLGGDFTEIPAYPIEKIYSAEYNCTICDFT